MKVASHKLLCLRRIYIRDASVRGGFATEDASRQGKRVTPSADGYNSSVI